MKFQAMYEQKDPVQLRALGARARMALLLLRDAEGRPLAGWTNAAPAGPGFIVHVAADDPQAGPLRAEARATLVFSEILSTIPSYWVDAEDGSRATNLHLHAEYDCAIQVLDEKAAATGALADLMRSFQAEGGHRPIHTEEALYGPKIKALCVAYLSVQTLRTKWKVGQIWPLAKRLEIVQKLKERGRPEDLRSVAEMEAWMAAHPPVTPA